MSRLGGPEIIIILVVLLLLFGAKKLPDLARSLGSSAKEFRKGVEEGMTDDDDNSSGSEKDAESQPSTDGTSDEVSPPSSES